MRILIGPIVIGTLVLAGTLPVAAQSKPATDQGASIHLAATGDTAAERNSYTQKARGEMRIWQQKLHDFGAKVQVSATQAQTEASKDLDNAWTDAENASGRLETAGEKDWDSAKSSFQTASHKLAVAWQKVNPSAKK
jgi:uncharacterized membrane protein